MASIRFLARRVTTARDTLAWLIEHTEPETWPDAVREVRATFAEIDRLRSEQRLSRRQWPRRSDGGVFSADPFRCLVVALNRRRSKRVATVKEEAELRALVADCHPADGFRDEALVEALADPEWMLYAYRSAVTKIATRRSPPTPDPNDETR